MAFLDNARGAHDLTRAKHVRDAVILAQQASDRGEDTDLVEVTVRYKRMSMSYEEAPVIVPREVLPQMQQLALNYLAYGKLHINAAMGNSEYGRFVALTPDKELLVIELVHKDHVPEQNQDDQRRAKLRGRRSHITSVDESQL